MTITATCLTFQNELTTPKIMCATKQKSGDSACAMLYKALRCTKALYVGVYRNTKMLVCRRDMGNEV